LSKSKHTPVLQIDRGGGNTIDTHRRWRTNDLDEVNAKDENTALHECAENGHLPMAQWMAEEGGADVEARGDGGYQSGPH
jgi:ankyrin repeat protein